MNMWFIDDEPVPRRRSAFRNRNNNVGNQSDEGVRRSSRKKKLLYGTFDPKILDRALYVDKQEYGENGGQPRKRKRNEVEPIDPDASILPVPVK